MTTKEKELLKKFDEAIELAWAALAHSIEYSGGDSETAAVLFRKIDELERSVKK